jgi:hypothetical protein
VRHTFQWVTREESGGFAGSGPSSAVSKVKLEGHLKALGDKRVVKASKAVNISHHDVRWAMENLKEVSKKLLGPAADLVNRAVTFQNFFCGTAIVKPKELGAP